MRLLTNDAGELSTLKIVAVGSGMFVAGAAAGYFVGRRINRGPVAISYLKDVAEAAQKDPEAMQKLQEVGAEIACVMVSSKSAPAAKAPAAAPAAQTPAAPAVHKGKLTKVETTSKSEEHVKV